MSTTEEKTNKLGLLLYPIIFLGVVGLYYAGYSYVLSKIPETDKDFWTHRGQFGDMFGAINALFSGLAFAGIIVTILLQREELVLQRKELTDTRKEFEQQNNTLRLQRFENTFYNLLGIHHQLIENIASFDEKAKGRRVFINLINEWNSSLYEQKILDFDAAKFTVYQMRYREYIGSQYYLISHYLQSLRGLHELVKMSTLITEADHEHYFGILKSSLSYPERRFLFYHIILGDSPDGTSSALKYVEKDLMFIGTVGKENLLNESHIKLLKHLET